MRNRRGLDTLFSIYFEMRGKQLKTVKYSQPNDLSTRQNENSYRRGVYYRKYRFSWDRGWTPGPLCPVSSRYTKQARQSFTDRKKALPYLAFNLIPGQLTWSALYHFLDSFGRPRTVLCQTMGKLTDEEKFCVTAMVVSRLRTTCHQPPGTNTVSPGRCKISN